MENSCTKIVQQDIAEMALAAIELQGSPFIGKFMKYLHFPPNAIHHNIQNVHISVMWFASKTEYALYCRNAQM